MSTGMSSPVGFLINFLSAPVVSGFTQAAVIVIILSQVKNMMGLMFGSAKDNVVQTLAGYVRNLPDTKYEMALPGAGHVEFKAAV